MLNCQRKKESGSEAAIKKLQEEELAKVEEASTS